MTERKPTGLSWESFVEHQIQEAQQAGKFNNLPGFGRPLADIDEPYDEMWWLKKKVRDENLSILPPALQIRVDVAKTLASIWELPDEPSVRSTLEALNGRIRQANFATTWGPPSTTMPLDIDFIVSEWRTRRSRR